MIINNKKTAQAIYKHIVKVYSKRQVLNRDTWFNEYIEQAKCLERASIAIDYTNDELDPYTPNPLLSEKTIDDCYKMFSTVLYMYRIFIQFQERNMSFENSQSFETILEKSRKDIAEL